MRNLSRGDYVNSVALALMGSVLFGLDLLVSAVLLDGAFIGVGFIGFGVVTAGIFGIVEALRERRYAIQVLRERERQSRLAERLDRLECDRQGFGRR